MAKPTTLTPAKLSFATQGASVVDVVELSVDEAMSSLYEVVVVATSPDGEMNLDQLVGKGAALRFVHHAGDLVWSGICAEAEQTGQQPDGAAAISTYRFVIRPSLYRTTLRRNFRIFEGSLAFDIVQRVLGEWEIPSEKLEGAKDHWKRDYVVQYGESDFDFLSRVLEEEGISYVFEHAAPGSGAQGADRPRFSSVPQTRDALTGSFPYRDSARQSTFQSGENVIFDVEITQDLSFGALSIGDYDMRRLPHTRVLAEARVDGREQVYEDHRWTPGALFEDRGPADGKTPVADDRVVARLLSPELNARRAERALAAERHASLRVTFKTTALEIAVGDVLIIGQHSKQPHPNPFLRDRKLLVIGRRMHGTALGIEHQEIVAVPAELPHRPAIKTPKPSALGVESAIVVGPKAQEIYTDELGRVRVQFHWDREHAFDEHSSCWIRVSQIWAGTGFGFVTIPRIGQEVLVGFIAGDPERPVVVGRVYGMAHGLPYPLPKGKTKSVLRTESSGGKSRSKAMRGYNEIVLDDAAGHEHFSIRAEQSLSTLAKAGESRDIGGSRTTHIGDSDVRHVGKRSELLVGKTTGFTVSDTGTPEIVLATSGASIRLVDGDITFEASGSILIKTGGDASFGSMANVDIQGGDEVLINDDGDGASPAGGPKPMPAKLGPAAPPGGGPLIAPPFFPEGHPAPAAAPGGFDELRTDPKREGPVDPRRDPRPKRKDEIPLDTYELQIVDELDRPLAGIEVVLNTPAGPAIKPTDGAGVARVDNAPEGIGSARIRDLAEVRKLLAGRQSQRRRMTKFPEADDVLVRTLTGAREQITLASGVKKTLMIVTRTDVYSAGHPESWGALTEEAPQGDQPWRFEAAREARLFLNADATRASASVVGEAGKAPEFVPPKVEPPAGEKNKWIAPNLYVVQAGDTLQAIAKKYLGDPARFTEIVGHNVGLFTSRSPDLIFVGEHLHMPSAAVPVFVKAQALSEDRRAAPGAPEPPRFMQVDLDSLHDLLFDGNLDRALGIMASQPIDPPEDPVVAPPSLLESLLVAAHRLELALEGLVDPPFAEVPEVYPPMVKKETA